ncbi:MAG: HAD-IC family P-type ATPase [Acutalibacteraceae bacterium]
MDTIRYTPSADYGLSEEQLKERTEHGLINYDTNPPTKSIKRIVKDNIFTLFNGVNLILFIAILISGSYKNGLFMGVVLSNTAIGIIQEIRAKQTIDKLSIISESKVKAVRSGKHSEIGIHDIALDDIIELSIGNQVPSDCIIIDGNCEVNEALITGESDGIFKSCGDTLLSGSFIISGKCTARVEHIGNDNYVATIFNGAKYIKKVKSEIMTTLKKIIKLVTIIIFPLGILLYLKQLFIAENTYQTAIVNTIAAVLGMIPEGLMLLSSTVLAVGIVRLAKHKVLVQELYCIEALARVDVLCLDKTGTITQGCMEVMDVIPVGKGTLAKAEYALNCLVSALDDNNPTFNAIKEKFNKPTTEKLVNAIPFSSERKWSGAQFEDLGTYIMGAAEFVLKRQSDEINRIIKKNPGKRVLVLAHSDNDITNKSTPDDIRAIAVIIIRDKLRDDAAETIRYFNEQGVTIKIISGDNVHTVSSIAKEAGIKNYDKYIDATTLKTYDDILAAADKYTIFGRVTPSQKKDIVTALKSKGHTVAMTGDGVNDVPALKESDCSIAIAGGSDAARNVSEMVLLDSKFSSMPKIVAEGRRCINNIQRSASLFLVKTMYSAGLAFLFLFLNMKYPFQPIQLTLTSVFTIGLPSFILALEPNKERVSGKFFVNIMTNAIPGAFTIILNVILVELASAIFSLSVIQTSTIAVTVTAFTGLLQLFRISVPFNKLRTVLFALMTSCVVVGIIFFKGLFSLCAYNLKMLFIFGVLALEAVIIFRACVLITRVYKKKHGLQ